MNKFRQGSQVEKMRKEQLEKEGWIVRTWPKMKWTTQDLWGCDLIAKKLGKTRYEQIKSSKESMPALRTETLKSLCKLWSHCSDQEEIFWIGYCSDKKMWKIIKIDDPYLMVSERKK